MRADHARSGAVLLEVLIAMTIFAIASAAVLVRAAEARRALVSARAAESRADDADQFMTRVAMWPVADLDRHLGTRAQGAWTLEIQHPSTSIYVVTLADSGSRHSLLHTLLYRTPPASVP